MGKEVAGNPIRFLRRAAHLSNALATGKPEATAATAPSLIRNIDQGKSSYLGKIQKINFVVELIFIGVRSNWS